MTYISYIIVERIKYQFYFEMDIMLQIIKLLYYSILSGYQGEDMKRKSFLKNLFTKYTKTITYSIINAFSCAFIYAFWSASYKILSIKAGEFPEESKNIIKERLVEVLPSIIVESIIKCLIIMIILIIPLLIYRFRIDNKINLFHEFNLYLKEKKEDSK